MPSGAKNLVINGLERAVSTDINRLQLFANTSTAEIFRWLLNVNMGVDDVQASSADVQNLLLTSPTSGEVIGGLVVRPILGTLGCSVDPGVAFLVNPDGDSDSSVYKLAADPGVNSASPLLLTANSSGQTRIDVIECQWTLNANVETDNRDIFNPLTGAFVATTVPKATQGFLTYRVRAGTPGSGFPGTQSGWMPLAVVSIPSGFAAISTTNCTFWDVRPYVGDRMFPPFHIEALVPRTRANYIQVDVSTGGVAQLVGYVESTATDPAVAAGDGPGSLYRLGGLFENIDSIGPYNLNLTPNQSGAITAGIGYVYLIEPFGLPRWAGYTVQGGALLPGNPRGIATVSMTAPIGFVGSPSSPLALPSWTGLGGTSSKAVCIAAAPTGSATVLGVVTDGKTQTPISTPSAFGKVFSTAGAVSSGTYNPGTDYPPHAKALHLLLTVVTGATAAGAQEALQLTVWVNESTNTTHVTRAFQYLAPVSNPTGGALASTYALHVRIPIPLGEPNFGITVDCTGSTRNATLVEANIVGWDVAA